MKYCKHCDAEFALEDEKHWKWRKQNQSPAGGYLECIARERASRTKYYAVPKNRAVARNNVLMRQYGITQDQYNYFMVMQSDRCAICLTDDKEGRAHWCVDHNHETGEVRGLLCNNCNRALGLLRDDADNVEQATNYLRRLPTNV